MHSLSLPLAYRAAHSLLLDRLRALECPLLPELVADGTRAGGSECFSPSWCSGGHRALLAGDEVFENNPASPALKLRLGVWSFVLSSYSADLLRVAGDIASGHEHKRAGGGELWSFRRAVVGMHVAGVVSAGVDALAIVTGLAPVQAQFAVLHTVLDLVQGDKASSAHGTVGDENTMRHIRLLHLASSSALEDSVFTQSIDLFPQSIILAAKSWRNTVERREEEAGGGGEKKKSAIPDPQQLSLSCSRLQEDIASKTVVLSSLSGDSTTTTTRDENYLPALEKLESNLRALLQGVTQFGHTYSTALGPMVEPLTRMNLTRSPLGVQLAALQDDKAMLDGVLSSCVRSKSHYATLGDSSLASSMQDLSKAPRTDDRTTLRLAEVRRVFEASCARLKQQGEQREERAVALFAASMSMANGRVPSPSPSPSRSRRSPDPALSASTRSKSILTSDRQLPVESEEAGFGSAGLFSPLRAAKKPPRSEAEVAQQQAIEDEAQARMEARAAAALTVSHSAAMMDSKYSAANSRPYSSSAYTSIRTPAQRSYTASAYVDPQQLTTAHLR